MRILVVNAGSSSLKLRIVEPPERLCWSHDITAHGGRFDAATVAEALAGAGPVDAVGHRIVHGGTALTAPTLLDAAVEQQLRDLTDLAPLHQPKSLAALDAVSAVLPRVPAVACFDTAFHATLPPAASTYAIPREWRERYDTRRYGFHGLSHAYSSRRAVAMVPGSRRIVICHLGSGASLAAVLDGVSVDTTMGFTPLEGLVMATRSGSIDPGLVLWLQEHAGRTAQEVAEALEHHSGLLGLAGTPDMREVVRRSGSGDPDARLALDVYLHRLRALVGAMTATLDGLDVLVFTGRVGERADQIRLRAAAGLSHLGVGIDPERNATTQPDADISAAGARVRTLVIEAREDLEIAASVANLLGG